MQGKLGGEAALVCLFVCLLDVWWCFSFPPPPANLVLTGSLFVFPATRKTTCTYLQGVVDAQTRHIKKLENILRKDHDSAPPHFDTDALADKLAAYVQDDNDIDEETSAGDETTTDSARPRRPRGARKGGATTTDDTDMTDTSGIDMM